MDDLRMYCVVSAQAVKLMGGNRGKFGSQVGHAFLHSYWDSMDRFPEIAKMYQDRVYGSAKKICLMADGPSDLLSLLDHFTPLCGVSLVEDAGKTVFREPTITCLGIGPVFGPHPDLRHLRPFI